ncbi:hypothetical protein OC844_006301 [Tilletia horrida]|nr:hypothetical protein OC844_006301 [Tilletia horrida]
MPADPKKYHKKRKSRPYKRDTFLASLWLGRLALTAGFHLDEFQLSAQPILTDNLLHLNNPMDKLPELSGKSQLCAPVTTRILSAQQFVPISISIVDHCETAVPPKLIQLIHKCIAARKKMLDNWKKKKVDRRFHLRHEHFLKILRATLEILKR